MQWLPGHKLKNRPYEIERELGEGGFGITYKAKDLTLDIPVVIKTPNSRLQRDSNYQKYVANFTREAKQLARLGLNPHPHIVRVSTLFREGDLPCIVMDFIPGQSLYDLVWTQGKLSETQAIEYIKQIGSALSVCHKAEIVHRDVHPNNILIHAENGKAVLIDFGISGTTQTSRNTHSGNRAFAPWEQVAYWEEENSKTPQVDIYTLAASLYFLVTGQEPTECLARKYNNRELIEPKQLNLELSDEINRAILRGVEVYPEERPSSMKEWLDLLSFTPVREDSNSERLNSENAIEERDSKNNKQVNEILPTIKYVDKKLEADRNTPVNQPVREQQKPKLEIPIETKKINKGFNEKVFSREKERSANRMNLESEASTKKQKNSYVKLIASGLGIFFVVLLYIYSYLVKQLSPIPDLDFSSDVENTKLETNKRSVPEESISKNQSENNTNIVPVFKPKLIGTLTGHSDRVASVAFSSDGQTLASGSWDDTVKMWNVSTKEEIATLTRYSNAVYSVAFSPDGQTLASGSDDDTVKMWNVSTKEEIATLTRYSNAVYLVAFSPDGQTLATGSGDDTVKLWNVSTKEEIATLTGHSGSVHSVAFSPDGKTLASGSGDDTIKLWDVPTNKEIASLTGHPSNVSSVAFSPDGKTLASGSGDNTIKLWDISTRQEVATLTGHSEIVYSVAFSPDGQTLASGSEDNTIKLWDVSAQKEIATLTGHSAFVYSVEFSPDGQTLASGSGDKTIKLWKIPVSKRRGAFEEIMELQEFQHRRRLLEKEILEKKNI